MYESPALAIVGVKTEGVICDSLRGGLEGWNDSGSDAWGGSDGGSNGLGGWTDNSGSAW